MQLSQTYNPLLPRNVAMWAVVKAFAWTGRAATIKALEEAGYEGAEEALKYLERRGYVSWT